MTQPRCSDRCYRMTESGLCEWCARRAGFEVTDLRGLWTALHGCLQPATGHSDGRGSSEPGVGVRMDVLSFIRPAGGEWSLHANGYTEESYAAAGDQIGAVPLPDLLVSWAEMVAQKRNYAQRDAWTFETSRSYLSRNHDWICRQPWAGDYAAELHEAWRTAKTLTGQWESAQPQVGRYCPWCQAGALYQRPGEDTYECQERAGGCGRLMLRGEYEQMVRMGAAYLRQTGVV